MNIKKKGNDIEFRNQPHSYPNKSELCIKIESFFSQKEEENQNPCYIKWGFFFFFFFTIFESKESKNLPYKR